MPNIEFLTEKRFSLSTHLIEIATKNQLSLVEFLLLIYFEDVVDKTFDVDLICKVLTVTHQEVLEAFNHLLTLNLLRIEPSKDTLNKHCEVVSLVPMYEKLFEKSVEKQKAQEKDNIFDIFQKELGRKITPMEYEFINDWLEKDFSEELIIGALREAVYSGTSNLRYIGKVLYEWRKQGYHNMKDVEKGLKTFRKDKESHVPLFDYNWLDDESE